LLLPEYLLKKFLALQDAVERGHLLVGKVSSHSFLVNLVAQLNLASKRSSYVTESEELVRLLQPSLWVDKIDFLHLSFEVEGIVLFGRLISLQHLVVVRLIREINQRYLGRVMAAWRVYQGVVFKLEEPLGILLLPRQQNDLLEGLFFLLTELEFGVVVQEVRCKPLLLQHFDELFLQRQTVLGTHE
jgi:hypothetical protein